MLIKVKLFVEKNPLLSFCLIWRIFRIVWFFVETTFYPILTHSWSSFFKACESFWFSKVTFCLLLFDLSSVKLNYCIANFFSLLLNFELVLLVNVIYADFFLLLRTFFLIMRESWMSRFKRSLFNFNFLQIFKVIPLLFNFFRNISLIHLILSQRNIT